MKKKDNTIRKTGTDKRRMIKYSFQGLIRKWSSVILIAASMFVLGILVGRGSAPIHFEMSDLDSELKERKTEAIEEEADNYRMESEALENKKFNFHDELRQPDPKVPADLPEKKSTLVKGDLNTQTESSESQNAISDAPEQGKLTIQIASFKDHEAAEKKVEELIGLGYPAYRISGEVPERGVWHRVRIGKFKTKEDAQPMLERLKNDQLNTFLLSTE